MKVLTPDRGGERRAAAGNAAGRFVGIDIGAEAIKIAELECFDGDYRWTSRELVEHGKDPVACLRELLRKGRVTEATGAAVTGRLARLLVLPTIPVQQAQARACRFLFGEAPATIVSIGSRGFSVLELREGGMKVVRENSRCSQGTGNFLRQLTERFGLEVGEAGALCAEVSDPAPLSGRCPVILKTDMTHLANKGENRARILAGLFDAVTANVLSLIKPRTCPTRVALVGGVSQSTRIRRNFARFLEDNGLELLDVSEADGRFLEALGAALLAAERPESPPSFDRLFAPQTPVCLEQLPPLRDSLHHVRRLPSKPLVEPSAKGLPLILGFDIGSTGSKVVAIEAESGEATWEGYRKTEGDPVGAAQALLTRFLETPYHSQPVLTVGVTGSGREIVGSLLQTCYGCRPVFVMNEIVAHAEGALHFDSRVDTIFEIGGQDAKYIRLEGGRVVDCAMNEACSAGTGSFIEEQGRKFSGMNDVGEMGREALEATRGISLGQHCSVFMAEVIDEAVAAGIEQPAILSGLYDSIIRNYLNRVKGNRSVGQVIFCQGMPFAADALAAAVARQTGSRAVIPPNPGTVGALGIALLARRKVDRTGLPPLETPRFLEARIQAKATFVCRSTKGCGDESNNCRIDSLKTLIHGRRQVFNWGGACSLYDKGAGKIKLPDGAPNPFRERERLIRLLRESIPTHRQGRRVAITDEFTLKGLFPFFLRYLHELGCRPVFVEGSGQDLLKRGIQEANVPFCAPMQLYHGLASRMLEMEAELLFMPMIRGMSSSGGAERAKTCPIVQAAPDIIRNDLCGPGDERVFSPVIDFGEGDLDSPEFRRSCRELAARLDRKPVWREAWKRAKATQDEFDRNCLALGEEALRFSKARGLPSIVVLGRAYTIHHRVLNSNLPALLREQGAMAIPVDCYPFEEGVPVFQDIYWGYAQRILRAAHQVRRSPGVYALYASNYSCGPDSFNLHFCGDVMDGKPFAVVETDGHSGDAGTKTRVEAFLHCVREDFRKATPTSPGRDFNRLQGHGTGWEEMRARGERLLIPSMGPVSDALAASFRSLGIEAQAVPPPDREALRMGRRHTSGKECLPVCVTLGSLLQHLERPGRNGDRYAFLMPRSLGPCRFGVYNLLHRIVVERLGLEDRVRIWSPSEAGYFEGLPSGFGIRVFAACTASDLLHEMLLDARPGARESGAANRIYASFQRKFLGQLERSAECGPSGVNALWEVIGGRLFGFPELLGQAARAFGNIRCQDPRPVVLVVGEIYVRLDPLSNGHIVEELEARGLRTRLAQCNEWMEYVEHWNLEAAPGLAVSERLTRAVQQRIQHRLHRAVAEFLPSLPFVSVKESIEAAKPYVRSELEGEAVLTVGNAVHSWRKDEVDAVVAVGPLECMPNKIAEAQLFHAAEREGLLSITFSMNGEPIAPEALDRFAFEVHDRFRRRDNTEPEL